jgi:hypothetical protein
MERNECKDFLLAALSMKLTMSTRSIVEASLRLRYLLLSRKPHWFHMAR